MTTVFDITRTRGGGAPAGPSQMVAPATPALATPALARGGAEKADGAPMIDPYGRQTIQPCELIS